MLSLRPRAWLALAAVLLLGLALRWPVASLPLERDEGGYAYIAQRWLQGEAPYRESFDQKPPGIYAAYAAIERALGESPAAIHWGTQLWCLLTVAMVFWLGRKLFGEEAGFAAGALAAFMTVDHGLLANAANTERFMIAPLAAAFLAALLAAERESWLWALACGACTGLALLFKQVALTNAIFYAILLALSKRRVPLLGAFLAGAALLLVPVALYLKAAGVWPAFYDCVIGYNFAYGGATALPDYFKNFALAMGRTLPSLWPVYLFALFGLFQATAPAVRVVLAWLAFSFLGSCAGGYFRVHYLLQAAPPLAVLAGFGIAQACKKLRLPGRRALALLIVLQGVLSGLWYYLPGPALAKSRRLYGANPFPEAVAAAKLIAERTNSQDRVFIFGSEPEILYYARRKSAERYIYVYPLMADAPGTAARQAEALAQVRSADPKMVVTVFVRTSFLASVRAPLNIFNGVKDLLRGYHLLAVMPAQRGNIGAMVLGEDAQRMWKRSPMWYDRRIWGFLAVWEKN